MLTGKPLGAALAEAMRLKGVGPTEVAREFEIKPPSVYDWRDHGRIGKKHLGHLVAYFADVVPAAHWGIGDLPEMTHAPVSILATPAGYVRFPKMGLPVGAGEGGDMESEPEVVQWIDISTQWAIDHLPAHASNICVFPVQGTSMVRAGIKPGDLLFVDTSVRHFEQDGYYMLRYRNGWQVKRLRANVLQQQLEIVSMPTTGDEVQPVAATEESMLTIGGKVAAWWELRKF